MAGSGWGQQIHDKSLQQIVAQESKNGLQTNNELTLKAMSDGHRSRLEKLRMPKPEQFEQQNKYSIEL